MAARVRLPAPSQPSTAGQAMRSSRSVARSTAVTPPCSMRTASVPDRSTTSGCRVDLGAQQRLQGGLVEQVGLGPPVPPRRLAPREHGKRAAPRVEQAQPAPGTADACEALGHPGALQDAHRLVVEVDRARQRVHVGMPLEDGGGHAVAGQQERGGQPGRSGPDDHDRVRTPGDDHATTLLPLRRAAT